MTEELDKFPAEKQEEQEANETGKWAVMTYSGESFKVIHAGLNLLVDADKWIRDNIEEEQLLVPVRLGTPRRLEVARKVIEAEL